jgi:hypothetical protein
VTAVPAASETSGGEPDGAPALSIVVATDRFDTIRELVGHLRAQTERRRLELVLVAPSRGELGDPGSELDDFRHVQVVEVEDALASLPSARAAGVLSASAPVVAFGETHSFPEPGWAAALIEAHRGPWAAVGPAIGNARPGSVAAWGSLFVDYGPWIEPVPAGPVADLPGHNSSYKRAVLLSYGDALEELLEAETILHQDLRSQGHELYLEPAAKTRHLNTTELLPTAALWLHYSRGFASARARGWPPIRRAVYAIGSPLLPALRLYRVLRDIRRTGRRGLLPRALPVMLAAAIGGAIGELLGYAAGRGDPGRISRYELHRERYAPGAAHQRA